MTDVVVDADDLDALIKAFPKVKLLGLNEKQLAAFLRLSARCWRARLRKMDKDLGLPVDTKPRPPWDLLYPGVSEVRELLDSGQMTSDYDQTTAAFRDMFRAFKLDTSDEWQVYSGLVCSLVMAQMSQFSFKAETIDEETYGAMLGMSRSLLLILSEFIPADVRPHQ